MPKPERSKRTRGLAKINKDMKEIIHLAFHRAGGIDYLVEQAHAEPKAFMGLLGRIVPAEVRLDVLVALDLGEAMRLNQKNLDRLNTSTIDVTPSKPTKPLITKEK
jgi:hypothetical protein